MRKRCFFLCLRTQCSEKKGGYRGYLVTFGSSSWAAPSQCEVDALFRFASARSNPYALIFSLVKHRFDVCNGVLLGWLSGFEPELKALFGFSRLRRATLRAGHPCPPKHVSKFKKITKEVGGGDYRDLNPS